MNRNVDFFVFFRALKKGKGPKSRGQIFHSEFSYDQLNSQLYSSKLYDLFDDRKNEKMDDGKIRKFNF